MTPAGPGKITDALMKTADIISSLCIVEIKTPSADLVEKHQYRRIAGRPRGR